MSSADTDGVSGADAVMQQNIIFRSFHFLKVVLKDGMAELFSFVFVKQHNVV